jgi:hypothetical protein
VVEIGAGRGAEAIREAARRVWAWTNMLLLVSADLDTIIHLYVQGLLRWKCSPILCDERLHACTWKRAFTSMFQERMLRSIPPYLLVHSQQMCRQ